MIKIAYIDADPRSLQKVSILAQDDHFKDVISFSAFSTTENALMHILTKPPEIVILATNILIAPSMAIAHSMERLGCEIIILADNHLMEDPLIKNARITVLAKPLESIDLMDIAYRYAYKHPRVVPPAMHTSNTVYQEKKPKPPMPENKEDTLVINSSNRIEIISIPNISFIKADGSNSKIAMHGNNYLYTTKSIAYFQGVLKNYPDFIRCHKSYIANLKQVKSILKGKYSNKLIMLDDYVVEVSNSKRHDVAEFFKHIF
jgi:DNA-binding LytR/AlgR family response regulator